MLQNQRCRPHKLCIACSDHVSLGGFSEDRTDTGKIGDRRVLKMVDVVAAPAIIKHPPLCRLQVLILRNRISSSLKNSVGFL
jgi:hypothetical protein